MKIALAMAPAAAVLMTAPLVTPQTTSRHQPIFLGAAPGHCDSHGRPRRPASRAPTRSQPPVKFRASALNVPHRRNRPSTLMSRDRDAKPVLIIEEDAVNCASLAISQHDGLAGQLFLGLVQFAQDVHRSRVAGA